MNEREDYEVWGTYYDGGEPARLTSGSLEFCRGYVAANKRGYTNDYTWVYDPTVERTAEDAPCPR